MTATTGLVIDPLYDSSITNLQTTDLAEYNGLMSAIQTAISYFEGIITNNVTLTITFQWGVIGATDTALTPGALGESNSNQLVYTNGYNTVRTALESAYSGTSADPAQVAAKTTLGSTDPTKGATFLVNDAEAIALKLTTPSLLANQLSVTTDGYVGLDASQTFFWSQSSPVSGEFDAVGVLEHEISEVLGRSDTGGQATYSQVTNGNTVTTTAYEPLDLFRYASSGTLDQPFVNGYSSSASSYFSDNGTTLSDQYDTPTQVANGDDIADWNNSAVPGDSFDGASSSGVANTISTTDLQELAVLGYTIPTLCFLAGTHILTDHGEVAIEALQIGDRVVTEFDQYRPIRWIGQRQVDCRRHRAPATVWPVRVAAHAFGPSLPRRDLFLSPDHAVFIDNALVPVRELINGSSICQVEVDQAHYFHIELERHDIILAENVPAESYMDAGNRSAFANGGNMVQLHATFSAQSWDTACAPLLLHGPRLAAIKARVAGASGARSAA